MRFRGAKKHGKMDDEKEGIIHVLLKLQSTALQAENG
jgi:hypothetical protein